MTTPRTTKGGGSSAAPPAIDRASAGALRRRRPRHVGLAAIGLALLTLVPVARRAPAEPPGAETADRLRERLVAAHATAPRIHRAYELTLGAQVIARFELFREGRTHGMRLERRAPPADRSAVDIASNGAHVVTQVADAPRRFRLPMLTDPRGRAVVAAVVALGRIHGFDPPPLSEGGAQFDLTMPQADPTEPAVPDEVGLHAGLAWTSAAAPEWLDSTVWRPRPEPVPLEPGLVAARIGGFDAVLHESDGCIASVGGRKPGTDVSWTLRETPPVVSASAWRDRIAQLCRADDGTFDVLAADEEVGYHLARSVPVVAHGLGRRFASPVWRRPAMEVIANAAWADRATTEQWLAQAREEERSLRAARSADEPRAVRAVREQKALNERIASTRARILDRLRLTGLPRDVEADVRAQLGDWVARRLRLLSIEVRREADGAEGR